MKRFESNGPRFPSRGARDCKRKTARRSLEILSLESRLVLSTTPTTTMLAASAASIAAGQTLTLTASIADAAHDSISGGNVTFKDGSATLGTVSVTNGSASLPVSTLSTGRHAITAAFSGYQAYHASASGIETNSLIENIAGTGGAGYTGDGGPAKSATFAAVHGTAVDAAGDVFVDDANNQVIREVTPDGIIHTFAGSGTQGYAGDGGPATGAELNQPVGVFADAAGDVFIADSQYSVIREVTPDGIIHTVAGGDGAGYGGDGGPATAALLNSPYYIAVDASGDLFISDQSNRVVREVTPDGIIHTVAGTGDQGSGGDGGVATAATLTQTLGLAVDAKGDLYIADYGANVVREVTPDGIIHTVAGTGTGGYTGDGGAAISAELTGPESVAVDAEGDLFIADANNNVIREVTPDGIIHTVAGTGKAGGIGDGGAATAAELGYPTGISTDAAGDLFIADNGNDRAREVLASLPVTVTPAPATHFTVTGVPANVAAGTVETITVTAVQANGSVATGYTGTVAFSSDDLSAVLPANATLTDGVGTFPVTFETAGAESITATDSGHELTGSKSGIAVTYPTKVTITTSASTITNVDPLSLTATVTGLPGQPTPVGGSVTFYDGSTSLGTVNLVNGSASFPIASTAVGKHAYSATYSGVAGEFAAGIVGLTGANTIVSIAGNGTQGYTGDGGQATSAELDVPLGGTFDAAGDLFIADYVAHVVREVTPDGVIHTVAGNGTPGHSGDGGQATNAQLNGPEGLLVNAAGDLFIADTLNNVVREVTPDGIIHTIAGTGTPGYSGDGGPATSATLQVPSGLARDGFGNLFITDNTHSVVREITPDGIIHTYAGNGTQGHSGDGGPATSAELGGPQMIAVSPAGDLYFCEYYTGVVREVTPDGVIHTVAGTGTPGYSGDGGPATVAQLSGPIGLAFDAFGDLFIASQPGGVIREVTPDGIIHTIAGTYGVLGTYPNNGDGGPASGAGFDYTYGIAVAPNGSLAITDDNNGLIREILPSAVVNVTQAPATHFSVTSSPAIPTAGTPETITVTALDADGNVVPDYAGHVHLTSTDGQAILPPDSSLTAGVGTFLVTLKTAGLRSITATDAGNAKLAGTESGLDVAAASAARFAVGGAVSETAGAVETVTVTAYDPYGNIATGYAGTVHFTSTDGRAVLPPDAKLTEGVGTLTAKLVTAGSDSITATDTTNGVLTATQSGIVISPGPAAHLAVTSTETGPVAGTPLAVTVIALDAFGNVATGYAGTVDLASDDGRAVLPPASTLTGGVGTFLVTFGTAGADSITATDVEDANLGGTESGFDVTPASATHFVIAPAVGVPNAFVVTALDAYGNTATGYAGTVRLTSDDPSAVLPPAASLAGGVGTFRVILETPGAHSITATDAGNPELTATEPGLALVSVTGTVYLDENADGTYQLDEPGLAGRVVFLDLNGDGTLDPGDPSATTDAYGHFALHGGVAGEFPVVEATDQDATMRYVVDQSAAAYGGTVNVGVVPTSPVAPVAVLPGPFGGGPAPDADTAFVQSIYRAVLGRVGDNAEVATWTGRMASGMTRQGVASGFINSPEHRQDEVHAYYEDFLHRAPDATSATWVAELMSGVSEEAVAAAILDSPESQAAHPDSASFVDGLYLDVLGRRADAAGEASWQSALVSGVGREAVVADFIGSAEAIDQVIISDYTAFLRRLPEPGNPGIWTSLLGSPDGSATDVAIAILASPEFDEDAVNS